MYYSFHGIILPYLSFPQLKQWIRDALNNNESGETDEKETEKIE